MFESAFARPGVDEPPEAAFHALQLADAPFDRGVGRKKRRHGDFLLPRSLAGAAEVASGAAAPGGG